MGTEAPRSPHWALALRFGPASITKAIVAASALELGATTLDETHSCENGKYEWAENLYQDWKPLDELTTADTVIESSNICGIKIGQKLGAKRLEQTFINFGFGEGGTASHFPEARSGEIPLPHDLKTEKYIATIATGYGGAYFSPLEIVQAFGAMANGGNLMKPQTITDFGKPEIIRRVLSESNAQQMRKVLAGVMTRGTAVNAASKFYRLGGKTGTGYSHTHPDHEKLGGDSNMAEFVGIAPIDNPRLVILAVLENPTDQKGVHGATHAAPIFTEVAERSLEHLGVPHQK